MSYQQIPAASSTSPSAPSRVLKQRIKPRATAQSIRSAPSKHGVRKERRHEPGGVRTALPQAEYPFKPPHPTFPESEHSNPSNPGDVTTVVVASGWALQSVHE